MSNKICNNIEENANEICSLVWQTVKTTHDCSQQLVSDSFIVVDSEKSDRKYGDRK